MLKNSVKYVKYTKYNWQLAISNWQGLPKIGHSEQLQFCLLPIVYRLLAIPKTLLSPEHYKYTHHFLADGGGRNKAASRKPQAVSCKLKAKSLKLQAESQKQIQIQTRNLEPGTGKPVTGNW